VRHGCRAPSIELTNHHEHEADGERDEGAELKDVLGHALAEHDSGDASDNGEQADDQQFHGTFSRFEGAFPTAQQPIPQKWGAAADPAAAGHVGRSARSPGGVSRPISNSVGAPSDRRRPDDRPRDDSAD